MTSLSWRLVNLASHTLSADERDAVLGDLAESRTTGEHALRDVLGLIARRQGALWLAWQPWVALILVAVPLGWLLSWVSRWWASEGAVYSWLYINNWTSFYLKSPGARFDLASAIARFLLHSSALIGWSWTCGFAIGSLSRRTSWVSAMLFLALVAEGAREAAHPPRVYNGNAVVFALTFYRTLFPSLIAAFLVLLPTWRGLRRSSLSAPLPLYPTVVGAILMAVLTIATSNGLEGSVMFGTGLIRPNPGPDRVMGTEDDPRPLWPLSLLMFGPTLYVVAATSRQRWHSRVDT